MYMHEYGIKGAPVILMLHPMGITGKKLYEIVGSKFKGEYYILAPDMGNHGEETEDFVSAQAEAESIYEYLLENNIAEIKMIYGASMGAAVALQMIKHDGIKIGSMYLDGAPVAKLSFIMQKLFGPVLVWQKSIYMKDDENKLKEFIDRWGKDVNAHMSDCFKKFSKESIYNIAKACVIGNGVDIPSRLQEKIYMDWGADEEFAKSSPKFVRKTYPEVNVIVREGYNHCEYMMKENESYVSFIESIIK